MPSCRFPPPWYVEVQPACFIIQNSTCECLSAPTPGPDSACHDRHSNPTGGSCNHLANDRDDVEAIQGWDQALEDYCANNSAHSSGSRVSEGT